MKRVSRTGSCSGDEKIRVRLTLASVICAWASPTLLASSPEARASAADALSVQLANAELPLDWASLTARVSDWTDCVACWRLCDSCWLCWDSCWDDCESCWLCCESCCEDCESCWLACETRRDASLRDWRACWADCCADWSRRLRSSIWPCWPLSWRWTSRGFNEGGVVIWAASSAVGDLAWACCNPLISSSFCDGLRFSDAFSWRRCSRASSLIPSNDIPSNPALISTNGAVCPTETSFLPSLKSLRSGFLVPSFAQAQLEESKRSRASCVIRLPAIADIGDDQHQTRRGLPELSRKEHILVRRLCCVIIRIRTWPQRRATRWTSKVTSNGNLLRDQRPDECGGVEPSRRIPTARTTRGSV